MKRVILKQLRLLNFKGITEFVLEPDVSAISVLGDNATGKTTLFDGFCWLLFGKDSQNSANFDIKTLDETGEPVHGLEHAVEAVLAVDGEDLSLKKVYAEKWIKTKGSATAEFDGHTVDHYVDGVPSKKKEFDEAVKSVCGGDLFCLLANPRCFNETLHWRKRRDLLLSVCGDISDADVVESDDRLAALPEIIGKRSPEDHRKIVKAGLAEIDRELAKIPVRIDEALKSVAETDSEEAVKSALETARADRAKKAEELFLVESGGEAAAVRKALAEIGAKVAERENAIYQAGKIAVRAGDTRRRKLRDAFDKAEDEMHSRDRTIKRLIDDIKLARTDLPKLERKTNALRADWQKVNGRSMPEFKIETECPTCGQRLPEEKAEAARKAFVEKFNAEKAKDLAAISAEGKEVKRLREKVKGGMDKMEERIAALEFEKLSAAESLARAKKDLEEIDSKRTEEAERPEDPELEKLGEESRALAEKLDVLKEGAKGDAGRIRGEIAEIDAETEKLRSELLKIETNKKIAERIEALKNEERILAADYEKREGELYLMDRFVRTKVRMLEEKIDSKFQLVRFRLFKEQINGSLEECCEATCNGVPYASMNNGARINVGLDVCNTLSKHYGIAVPIFVDNAESVSRLIDTEGQQIRLVVSPEHKSLTVGADAPFDEEADPLAEAWRDPEVADHVEAGKPPF